MKNIFLRGLKLGLILNLSSIVFAVFYIFAVETQLTKPLDKFSLPLKLGTIVTSDRVYFKNSIKQRDSWSRIFKQFSFFVLENELRTDYLKPTRLLNWCPNQECFAHRIGYTDIRKQQFKYFTLDDWWANNKYFTIKDTALDELQLTQFLKTLPDGSLIVISEPFSIFAQRRSLAKFLEWALVLRSQHPKLKFEIGLQVHLQWIDAWWVRYRWLLPEFEKFSKKYSYPWGVSEFSNYDRTWKLRINRPSFVDSAFYQTDGFALDPLRQAIILHYFYRIFYQIEGLVLLRLRRAIVLHQTYQLHRDAVHYGAVRFVEWGNFQYTAWFVNQIDAAYESNYLLFDASGEPTDLWWAAMRGLKDGKIE